ncbi:hypothetical protein SAMN03159341_10274 [Paenibacillus sp. 1_12]|nr:hypothetical protein SAMN03159341_10274 [Paenibacillus sp. 1_12]
MLQIDKTIWAFVTLYPILHKLHYNRDRHSVKRQTASASLNKVQRCLLNCSLRLRQLAGTREARSSVKEVFPCNRSFHNCKAERSVNVY